MNNNNLMPFDLEVALKQPERVVYRNGEKPDDIANFKSGEIISKRKHSYYRHDIKGGHNPTLGYPSLECDLFLLPEFTPEEGKWYWVKPYEESDYYPMYFSSGYYWYNAKKHDPSDIHTIHPEPINPPE
jgi:hypothetical protein